MAKRAASDTVQLKVRMKERLRSQLEAEAAASGRSINGEIVSRLERSLWDDESGWEEVFGGKDIWAILTLVGHAARIIMEPGGRGYAADLEKSIEFRGAVHMIFDELAPQGSTKAPTRTLRDSGEVTAMAVLESPVAKNFLRDPSEPSDLPRAMLTGVLHSKQNWRRYTGTPSRGSLQRALALEMRMSMDGLRGRDKDGS